MNKKNAKNTVVVVVINGPRLAIVNSQQSLSKRAIDVTISKQKLIHFNKRPLLLHFGE